MFDDYYKLLEIHPGSNEQMIKDAYEAKLQKLTIDAASRYNNSALIKAIQKAYETLIDVPSRVKYDQYWLTMREKRTGFIPDDKPKIHYLRSSKNQFELNDEITISWDTSNCDEVILHPFGTVGTIGTYTFKIEKNSFYIDIELIAKNKKQHTSIERSIKLNKASTFFPTNDKSYTEQHTQNIDLKNKKMGGNKFRKQLPESTSITDPDIKKEFVNTIKKETILHKLIHVITKWLK